MARHSNAVTVAKITSRQAIIVAVITAVSGLTVGYFASQKNSNIPVLKSQILKLQTDLYKEKLTIQESQNKLSNLKQRVRDILGPKKDAIQRMTRSLARMKNDSGISKEHRERLSDIANQLNKIDTKVLFIVE